MRSHTRKKSTVVPLIHNLHGGRSRIADRRLRHLANKVGNKISQPILPSPPPRAGSSPSTVRGSPVLPYTMCRTVSVLS